MGKIPILVEENKEPLFDSKVIVQYLDHINEAQLMYPKDPQDNISARLIESVADGVCDAIVLVFLKNLGMKHCAVMTGFKDKKRFMKEQNIFQIILVIKNILWEVILTLQMCVRFRA